MQVLAKRQTLGFTLRGHHYRFVSGEPKEAPVELLAHRDFSEARESGALEVFGESAPVIRKQRKPKDQ